MIRKTVMTFNSLWGKFLESLGSGLAHVNIAQGFVRFENDRD